MAYKVYGIGTVAVVALIVAIAYNPVQENFDLDTEQNFIITTYQQSAQWEWLKGQVENAEESIDIKSNENDIIGNTNDIKALEDRLNKTSLNVSTLNNKITQLEAAKVASSSATSTTVISDEITDFYTTDNDSNKEDRFDQSEIMYFYLVVDTDERYAYYEIINDDTNDVIKDKRLTISPNVDNLVWAWSIPSNQTAGDYYIEVEVGNDVEKRNFDVRTS
jgi:predicted RNase H-like nuclease (RuvC/YqgF family)